jgi:predicted nucleic acid-binding protein
VIVVDSNIIAYLCLGREYGAAAATLLKRDGDWAAPVLWRSEVRNAMTGHMRRGELRPAEARGLLDEAEDLMRDNEYRVDSRSVLDLVQECDCSAYDCEYVALAMYLGTKLVTMDGTILRAFPEVAVPLPGF